MDHTQTIRHKSNYGLTHLITNKIPTEGPPIRRATIKNIVSFTIRGWMNKLKTRKHKGSSKKLLANGVLQWPIVRKKI